MIVPAYNNPEALRACLFALSLQSLPPGRFEILVVDDGSSPPLDSVTRAFPHLPLTCLRIPNAGPARARNHGARAAAGRFLAFTDHDCRPTPAWLASLATAFSSHPAALLGGPKENGLPENLASAAHQIAANYAEAWFRRSASSPAYFTTNNLAVPRELFLAVGGFDESFPFAQEDREFGARWADRGHPAHWVPDAAVLHCHRLTIGALLRQHFHYGLGAPRFRAARRQNPAAAPVRFEGLRFHTGLLLAPFTQKLPRPLTLSTLLLATQAAYAAGVLSALFLRNK